MEQDKVLFIIHHLHKVLRLFLFGKIEEGCQEQVGPGLSAPLTVNSAPSDCHLLRGTFIQVLDTASITHVEPQGDHTTFVCSVLVYHSCMAMQSL